MPALVVVQGDLKPHSFEVSPGSEFTIGRAIGNTLVLSDPSVSRRHARIVWAGGSPWVEDLKSSNGTQVNGTDVERQELKVGDVLGIGSYRFRFEAGAGRAAVPAVRSGGEVVVEDDRPGRTAPVDVSAATRPTGAAAAGAAVLARVDTRKLAAGETPADPESLRRKLRIFYSFVDAFGTLLDLDQVIDKVADSLFQIFTQTERAFVLLADPETGALSPRAVRTSTAEGPPDRITVSRTIVDECIREGRAILMADAASDQRFARAASVINFNIRSAMCVPLVSRRQTHGIIYVDTTNQRSRFTEDDLYILAGVGAQSAVAIENASLHREVVRSHVRQHDIALASEVQRSFLPREVPAIPNYEFFAHYSPAFEVGGDFYDFLRLPSDRVAVVLGDVSGKGFSAALMMAKLVSDIRHTALTVEDPRAVVSRVNLLLSRNPGEVTFATLLYAMLDPAAGRLSVVSAGHMGPLVRHVDGRIEEPARSAGLPVGVSDLSEYDQDVVDLAPGDTVLLYTDGISEARAAEAKFYGADRLRRCAAAGPPGAGALGEFILKDVRDFVGRTVQSDDITLVGFSRIA